VTFRVGTSIFHKKRICVQQKIYHRWPFIFGQLLIDYVNAFIEISPIDRVFLLKTKDPCLWERPFSVLEVIFKM